MNLFSRSVLFCLFGYLMYFKPAQPFLVDFLEDTKNFTPTQVYSDIFPIWTYAQLLFMIIFGVLAEFTKIGYLPIVIFGAICLFSEPFFMLFGTSLATMQFCEVAVGAGVSSIQVWGYFFFKQLFPRKRKKNRFFFQFFLKKNLCFLRFSQLTHTRLYPKFSIKKSLAMFG